MNGDDVDDNGTRKIFDDAYLVAYKTLYEAKKPITCSVTGATFDVVPKPCAVILDVSLPMYYSNCNSSSFSLSTCTPSPLPFLNYKLLEQLAVILYQLFLPQRSGLRRSYVFLVRNVSEVQEILKQKLMQRWLKLGCPPMRLVLRCISRYSYHLDRTNVILYPKMYYRTEGKVIRIPGLPAMYDYEYFPQKVWPNRANGVRILVELTNN